MTRPENRYHPDAGAGRPAGGGSRRMDWVVVERACYGERVDMSSVERQEAVRRLTAQGLSAESIAERLCLSSRSVQRHRAALAGDRQRAHYLGDGEG